MGASALVAFVAVCAAAGAWRARGDGTTKRKRALLTHSKDAGLEMRELANAGADADAPMVFGVHGRGDTPESFSDLFHAYETPARFYFPRAPTPHGEGYTWFSLAAGMSEEALAANVRGAAEALHARVAAVARGQRYVLVGFSQGGFLAYAFAALYPGELVCALPIAGALPAPLRPAPGGLPSAPPLFAFHGGRDALVDPAWDRASAQAFAAAGAPVQLREYPELGHRTHAALRGELYAALDGCLRRARLASP